VKRAVPGLLVLGAFLAVPNPAASDEAVPPVDRWRLAPFSATRGAFDVRLKGLIQVDGRSLSNWTPRGEGEGSQVELRRSRIGAALRWRRIRVEVEADPHEDEGRLKDAFVAYRFAKAFSLQAGRMKLPGSPERLRSVARTDFVERSLLATYLSPDRDWGVLASGVAARRLAYQAGIFAGDGESVAARAETTVAARLGLDLPRRVEVGASFSRGDVRVVDDRSRADARPNGLRAEDVAGYSFFERHSVQGQRQRLGLDGSWGLGPASLKAEFFRAREDRQGQGPLCDGPACEDLSAVEGTGWSLSGLWLVNVPKKRRNDPGPRSLELGVRFESLRFDDPSPTSPFESIVDRARNIRPQGLRAFTAGATFRPLPWTRVMANVVVERFRDPLTAPEAGRVGDYVTVLGRVQVRLP
jgi:phosphate-selective porin